MTWTINIGSPLSNFDVINISPNPLNFIQVCPSLFILYMYILHCQFYLIFYYTLNSNPPFSCVFYENRHKCIQEKNFTPL